MPHGFKTTSQPDQQAYFRNNSQTQPGLFNLIKQNNIASSFQSNSKTTPGATSSSSDHHVVPDSISNNVEKMPLAFPPTYGHHLAKLTADQQNYLLQQQKALVLTMEQLAAQNNQTSPAYLPAKNSPVTPNEAAATLQRMSSSSSSSSSTTASNSSPLVNNLLKLQQKQQPIFNLPVTQNNNHANSISGNILNTPLLTDKAGLLPNDTDSHGKFQNGYGNNFQQSGQNLLQQQQPAYLNQFVMPSPSLGYNQQQMNNFFMQQQHQNVNFAPPTASKTP